MWAMLHIGAMVMHAGDVTYTSNITYDSDVTSMLHMQGNVTFMAILHIWAVLFKHGGNVTYGRDVRYTGLLSMRAMLHIKIQWQAVKLAPKI